MPRLKQDYLDPDDKAKLLKFDNREGEMRSMPPVSFHSKLNMDLKKYKRATCNNEKVVLKVKKK